MTNPARGDVIARVPDLTRADAARAIEAADSAESLGRAAHRLKGGSLSLGLIEVRELCVRLEEAGRGGRFAAVATDIGAVRGAVGRAVAALKALLSAA